MLVHIVLFNFKSGYDESRREEILALSREKLAQLPGVKHLLVGKTIKPDSEFEYAISMYFEDDKALIYYKDHPDHVAFRDNDLFPHLAEKIGLDYMD